MLLFKPKQAGKGREIVKIKIIVPISSYRTCYKKFQKNSKKIQKIKKRHYSFFLSQNKLGKEDKEWKWKLLFLSVPTWPGIENFKKIAKKFKKPKNIILASFQAKTSWERTRKSENKNYRFDQFLPDLL